MTRTQIDN